MKLHKPPFHLKEIKIEVTHDCNLKCIHCSSVAEKQSSRNMCWDDCRRIIDEAAEIGVKKMAFSGGEPLLCSYIKDAVTLAHEYGMKVFLYTTGNVPKGQQLLEELYESGLNRVMFSIFSSEEFKHENVTCVQGSFNQSLSCINKAVDIGLKVEFHFVPLSKNYKEINDIVKMASACGVERVSILRLVPQGRAEQSSKNLLSHSQNIDLRKNIIKLKTLGFDIRTGSPYNFLMLKDEPACCSGIDRLTVGPELSIYPCDAFKHISPEMIGTNSNYSSLQDNSLKDCWEKSAYFNKVREYLTTPFAEVCADCNMLERCLSGCLAQKIHYNGKMIKCPDPMCLQERYNGNNKFTGI